MARLDDSLPGRSNPDRLALGPVAFLVGLFVAGFGTHSVTLDLIGAHWARSQPSTPRYQ